MKEQQKLQFIFVFLSSSSSSAYRKNAFHFLLFSSIYYDDLHDFPFLLHIVREKRERD